MTFDEYSRAVTQIHQQLQELSRQTNGHAWMSTENFDSPRFAELMQRHAELIKLSTQLTERLILAMKGARSPKG